MQNCSSLTLCRPSRLSCLSCLVCSHPLYIAELSSCILFMAQLATLAGETSLKGLRCRLDGHCLHFREMDPGKSLMRTATRTVDKFWKFKHCCERFGSKSRVVPLTFYRLWMLPNRFEKENIEVEEANAKCKDLILGYYSSRKLKILCVDGGPFPHRLGSRAGRQISAN